MAIKHVKCPQCGGSLDINSETKDFYCQYCGSKLREEQEKIIIEQVNRIVDEAKLKELQMAERAREESRKNPFWKSYAKFVFGMFLLIIGLLVGAWIYDKVYAFLRAH